MQVFLVYDHANELQEVHTLEGVAETRAEVDAAISKALGSG